MTTDDALAGFVALSRYLTGADIASDLAAAYLARVKAERFGTRIEPLIALFRSLERSSTDLESDVRSQIIQSSEHGPLAQQVMLLWYTSAFEDSSQWKFGTPDQHFRALIWPVIGAHPPALSGGYFGYWKYPPEH